MMSHNNITNTFKILQDPIRIRIIEMLRYDHDRREFLPDSIGAKGGFCPMDILMVLHAEGYNISNTKLSYHLKELKEKNIIHLVKEGKRFFYQLNKEGLEITLNWLITITRE